MECFHEIYENWAITNSNNSIVLKQDYTTVTASSMNHHHHTMMHYLSEHTHVSDILTINQTPRDSNHHHRTYVTYTPYPSTDPQKQNGSLHGRISVKNCASMMIVNSERHIMSHAISLLCCHIHSSLTVRYLPSHRIHIG